MPFASSSARSQRRSVASRIALFGNKLLDLERDTDGFIAQAAADRGQEPTRTNEGVTALDLAEKALKNAKAANEDMAKFLSSEEVEAIHTTDATTPRNPEELIGAEELRGKCRRLSGNSELGWRPSLLGCRPLTFQDASPADSPQHREESHITEHEDTSPADSPQHGEENHITEHEDDERAVERPATEERTDLSMPLGRQSAVSYTEGDWAGDEEYACAQAVARNLVSELYLKAQVKLAKDLNGQP
eukprot:g12957.t1